MIYLVIYFNILLTTKRTDLMAAFFYLYDNIILTYQNVLVPFLFFKKTVFKNANKCITQSYKRLPKHFFVTLN